ncbi:hypothetical protein [Haloarchaeobius sp. DFWS5]|uniref:hypothetical protein n=1 Tax=Haloarchaeobius sp. DFWS5 TaxID=3446114 RepID=UPI003EBC04C3
MSSAIAPPPTQMPELVERNIILRRKIWPRLHQANKNWVAIFVGETGSGKSWGAGRVAEALWPGFSTDEYAMSVEEFLSVAGDKSYPSGTGVVLDEAGVAANSRNWYDMANEVLNFLLQTWREQNRFAILTVPELDLIDSQVRRRFHHYIEMVSVNEETNTSKAKIQFIDTNRKSGKNYFKYHRMKDESGWLKRWKYINFNPPSDGLREAYEAKKQNYTKDLNEQLLQRIQEESEGDAEEMTPKEVAEAIIEKQRVDDYIQEASGGEYLNRDLLKMDWELSESESKQVKNYLIRECDLDVM